MEKLTKEEVMHIADLGKLKLTEKEVEKYKEQLTQLFSEIEKVNSIEMDEVDKMISPSNEKLNPFIDEYKINNNTKKLIENAPTRFENFIEVAGVFDE